MKNKLKEINNKKNNEDDEVVVVNWSKPLNYNKQKSKLCQLFCLVWFIASISFVIIIFNNEAIRKSILILLLNGNNVGKLKLPDHSQRYNLDKVVTQNNLKKTTKNADHSSLIEKNVEEEINKQNTKSDIEYSFNMQCSPQQNVVFLKTHKTGSSTITNILNRYSDLQELTVLLPAMGDSRFSWPRRFHWSSADLLRLDGQLANMIVNHARYDRPQMDMMMANNTKYISIIRHPVWQFESSFYYFEMDKIFRLRNFTKPIEKFLTYPDEHIYNLTMKLNDLPDDINLLQSGMFYDFGFEFMDTESDEIIQRTLSKLENEFQIIMIMEYFDESLVLLKIEFCWDFDDILYIKQNERLKPKSNLTDETMEKIKKWNRADTKLYEHFNKTFWKKIDSHGEKFWDEVKEFKIRNKAFRDICSPQKIIMKAHKINVNISSYVMNPKVNRFHRYLCEKALMTEVDYLRYFRKKFQQNFGYQRILIAEGVRKLLRRKPLQERMKRMHLKSARFFLPAEIR